MKKRAAKAKRPSAAKTSRAKTKPKTKPAAKTVVKPVARPAAAVTPKATPYSPAPLKGDGWPPFRYPLQ